MSRLTPAPRCESRVSNAPSTTTYHSFPDLSVYGEERSETPYVDVLEYLPPPERPSNPIAKTYSGRRSPSRHLDRQDSGYESMESGRPSLSSSCTLSLSRTITNATVSPAAPVAETTISPPIPQKSRFRRSRRPTSSRRSTDTAAPVSYIPQVCTQTRRPSQHTFFHFPSAESSAIRDVVGRSVLNHAFHLNIPPTPPPRRVREEPRKPSPVPTLVPPTPPPQTTHYWTSDRTRRLEYAAIDAASRGFRGWVRRHLVPDCIVPKEKRRLGFGDDDGSVRRYRLELEYEASLATAREAPKRLTSFACT